MGSEMCIRDRFEGLSWLHLDCEEVVAIFLEFLPRGILVEEDVANLLKASERPCREGIKPVQGRALETGRKHSEHEVAS